MVAEDWMMSRGFIAGLSREFLKLLEFEWSIFIFMTGFGPEIGILLDFGIIDSLLKEYILVSCFFPGSSVFPPLVWPLLEAWLVI